MLCERLWQSGEMTKRCNILDIAVEFEKNGRQMIMKNGLHEKKERKRDKLSQIDKVKYRKSQPV